MILDEYIGKVMNIFRQAHVVLPKESKLNLYHHLGKGKIEDTGAAFFQVVNRDYCKSYVAMTKGQKYPNHYHRIKTESFYVLYGDLHVELDGKEYVLFPGEMLNVDRDQDHTFWTDNGTLFEEISTMYVPNDSIYLDEEIKKTSYAERRTTITGDEWKELREKWIK